MPLRRAPAIPVLWAVAVALGWLGCAGARGHGHGGDCPVPSMPRRVVLRERLWSILKTVDVYDGRTLLGYVYASAFTLDGRAKWVSALDGRVLASSVESIQSAPTMTFMPQLAPTLSVLDCRARRIATVEYALDALLTIKTPGGAVAATSAVGGEDGAYITVHDRTGRARARIRRLPGWWTDEWELQMLSGREDSGAAIRRGKRLRTAEAEMRALTKKARFLEKAGKRIEAAAMEIEVQALRERVSELEREQRRQDTQLTRGALVEDPRVLIMAIAAESPAINVGKGIQLGKAPVYVFVATLILGWGLCCCYLGKHFYLNSSRRADGYTEMKGDDYWRDTGRGEDDMGGDVNRLDSLFRRNLSNL